ncbi:hypothetical protein [Sphingomonas azotifigens]|uniref:hypothetical protein n=1 Tax=Sphingomonas azotifigens TaxID=330920 RepID=UPI000A03E348|nr:hypothetical protein [Sphingomonas azotifigens]
MKLPLVPLAAVTFGGASAFVAAAFPAVAFGHLLLDGGVSALLPAAPDAGWMSRPLLVMATGAIGALAGAMLVRVTRPRAPLPIPASLEPLPMPIIRRADAHPDLGPCPPLRAAPAPDLPPRDAPAMRAAPEDVPTAERALPADLDQPLAAFDPQAIPAVPLPPPVPPRRGQAANAGSRGSVGRDAADRLVRPETDATVHALLERLERGVVRRNQVAQARGRARPERDLDDALATLRNLARQG